MAGVVGSWKRAGLAGGVPSLHIPEQTVLDTPSILA